MRSPVTWYGAAVSWHYDDPQQRPSAAELLMVLSESRDCVRPPAAHLVLSLVCRGLGGSP